MAVCCISDYPKETGIDSSGELAGVLTEKEWPRLLADINKITDTDRPSTLSHTKKVVTSAGKRPQI